MKTPLTTVFQKAQSPFLESPKKAVEKYLFAAPDMTTVWCDGGEGEYGHPRVYLACRKGATLICPYCSEEIRGEVQNTLGRPASKDA